MINLADKMLNNFGQYFNKIKWYNISEHTALWKVCLEALMPYTKAVLNIVILDLYSGEIFGPDHPF